MNCFHSVTQAHRVCVQCIVYAYEELDWRGKHDVVFVYLCAYIKAC